MQEQDDPCRSRVGGPGLHGQKGLARRGAERPGLAFDAQRAAFRAARSGPGPPGHSSRARGPPRPPPVRRAFEDLDFPARPPQRDGSREAANPTPDDQHLAPHFTVPTLRTRRTDSDSLHLHAGGSERLLHSRGSRVDCRRVPQEFGSSTCAETSIPGEEGPIHYPAPASRLEHGVTGRLPPPTSMQPDKGASVTSPSECRTDTPGVTLLDVKCYAVGSC